METCSDYRHIPELDRYDQRGLDENSDFSAMSEGDRRAAEEEMRRRDREEGRVPGGMRRGLEMFGGKYQTRIHPGRSQSNRIEIDPDQLDPAVANRKT